MRVKVLDYETIYFNFRLDIGLTNFNDMDGRESKIRGHSVGKNPKK